MSYQHTDGTIYGTGALDKPEHYGASDAPLHSEIAGAMAPANWVEKPLSSFATYPKRNQGQKGDCTTYTAAKLLSIDYFQESGIYRELSPDMVYPYVCGPGGGANSLDVMDFVVQKGMGVDALYPSDGLTESEAESQANLPADNKNFGLFYRPSGIIQCATDFETIAQILQSYQAQGIKKAVGITLVGQNNGSWLGLMPNPPIGQENLWYHRVPVTDFGLLNGQEVLAFDNSWGTSVGNGGQQFLSKAYAPFIYGGIYTLSQPPLGGITPPSKPVYQWSTPLSTGSSGPDVLALQKALQSLGMFPISSVIAPNGNYYGITKAGVTEFQAAFGLPQTGAVDSPTIGKLNSLFA